jgi:IS5 family transposase
MKNFKRHRDFGFFDVDIRLSKLSQLGDPLEKLSKGIDFEIFRNILVENLRKEAKGKGGRPAYDYVMLFKILILQRYYNLSDEQVEYQINDRMSFMRFLDLTISDDIPDSRTVWKFKEQLIDMGLIEVIFNLFLQKILDLKLVVKEGKIVDASFVEVPIQRNKKEENDEIKAGKIPVDFEENPQKKAQKDTDARWTKKNGVNYYGYKNHIKIDVKSKIITKYVVTDASVHDSQVIDNLLDESDKGEPFYADSAYTGENQEAIIKSKEMLNKVCEKGYRNKLLDETQKANNQEKSRIRSRVEHIFGFMETNMNGMYLYSIGMARISAAIGLMNLTYNMFRLLQIKPNMG